MRWCFLRWAYWEVSEFWTAHGIRLQYTLITIVLRWECLLLSIYVSHECRTGTVISPREELLDV